MFSFGVLILSPRFDYTLCHNDHPAVSAGIVAGGQRNQLVPISSRHARFVQGGVLAGVHIGGKLLRCFGIGISIISPKSTILKYPYCGSFIKISDNFQFVAPLRIALAVLYFYNARIYSLFSDGLADISLYNSKMI